jgi:putative ABC transport system ATP-binding protein
VTISASGDTIRTRSGSGHVPILRSAPAVKGTGLLRRYQRGAETICALKGIDFEIETGEFLGIVGRAGAGKTTLLNLIGLMDRPSEGELVVLDHNVTRRGTSLDRLRRDNVGFVFQEFYLISFLTALENVMLPALWSGRNLAQKARALLDRVGLSLRITHRPGELSGGEMQRVAVARALVNSPRLLLADEPTGNLDTRTRDSIFDLLEELNRTEKLTVVVATHDLSLEPRFQRVIRLEEGNVCG